LKSSSVKADPEFLPFEKGAKINILP
jgi:hypothetical protein